MRTIGFLVLLSFSALLMFAPLGWAQETEEPAAERPKTALERTAELEREAAAPQEVFATAIQRLRARKEFVVRAHVKHQQPEADAAQPGPAGQNVQVIMRATIVGQDTDPFEGKVEAWRDARAVSVVVSEKGVPGFGLYITADRTIRRATYEEKAPGLAQLQAELLPLLDRERFVRHVLAADLKHRVDSATGDHVWSGKISRDVVRPERAVSSDPAAMVMMSITPRVLRANVELRLTKEGKLTQTRVTIVHNDPAREMLRGRIASGVLTLGFDDGKEDAGDKKKHAIEGVSTIYTLDLTAKDPSERAKAFKREMARALGGG